MSEHGAREQDESERTVKELRNLLVHDAELPPGIIARLQSNSARARHAAARSTVSERIVLGALLFSAASIGQTAAGIAAALVIATVYVLLLDTGAEAADVE